MKHFIAIIFFACLLISCEKEVPIRYEVRLDGEFEIPLGLNTVETHYTWIRNMPTFYVNNAQRFNADTSSITNIQASKGLLRAKFGVAEFDFVERISVWAVSVKNPNLKREMYYLDFNPLNTREELRMLSSTSELKQIMKEEYIDLEIRFNLRRFPSTNIRTVIDFGYAVF